MYLLYNACTLYYSMYSCGDIVWRNCSSLGLKGRSYRNSQDFIAERCKCTCYLRGKKCIVVVL